MATKKVPMKAPKVLTVKVDGPANALLPGNDAFVMHRARYMAMVHGVSGKDVESLVDAVLVLTNYNTGSHVSGQRAKAIVVGDPTFNATLGVLPWHAKCTCGVQVVFKADGSVDGFDGFGGKHCPEHSDMPLPATITSLASRTLRRVWAAANAPAGQDKAVPLVVDNATGAGSLEEFKAAWALWLLAHGESDDKVASVTHALTMVPLVKLPPFIDPPGEVSTTADHFVVKCAAALTKVHAAIQAAPLATPTKKAKGPVLATGGYITSATIATGEPVPFTLGSPAYATAPTTYSVHATAKNELVFDVGGGRTLRFFATSDGRLDVEFTGGDEVDMTTRAALLLTTAAQMVQAKAPKNIAVTGPSVHQWLTDTLGVKLKVHAGVSPGTYYLTPHGEEALKNTYVLGKDAAVTTGPVPFTADDLGHDTPEPGSTAKATTMAEPSSEFTMAQTSTVAALTAALAQAGVTLKTVGVFYVPSKPLSPSSSPIVLYASAGATTTLAQVWHAGVVPTDALAAWANEVWWSPKGPYVVTSGMVNKFVEPYSTEKPKKKPKKKPSESLVDAVLANFPLAT